MPVAFNLDEYTPVSERIKQFWIDHPNGAIHSDLVFDDGTRCVVKTVLWLDKNDSQPTTTDYAEEVLSDRGVNSTSRIENCTTSSQGRSLAAAGYLGADWTKKPSREEMQKVQRMSGETTITEGSNLASEKQQNMIRAVCKSQGLLPPHNLQSMTKREASIYIDGLKNGEPPAPSYDSPEEPF
jgi:hypothetical protein